MKHQRYPSDLSDSQWAVLESWIAPPRPGGRPRKTNMRAVVNAILYLTREGCSWRALPHDFPPWKTVYNYFQQWTRDGTWDRLLTILRWRVRQKAGGGEEVGSDGGKKVRGRKRHIVVDTMGLLLAVVVTAANVDDARAAQELFAQLPGTNFPRLEVVQADSKYHNHELERWLRVHHRAYRIWVVSRPAGERRFSLCRRVVG